MDNNSPLVSVIMPAYNHEKYVQAAIQSIISQTYQNIELLIVDDGSSDSTWNRICEMKLVCEKRFSRVYFERKHNEGTCLTLNRLVLNSFGPYVFLIASDDMAMPTAIEKLVSFLEASPDYALAVGDNQIIDEKGNSCFWDFKRNIVYDSSNATYHTFKEFIECENNIKLSSEEFGSYSKLHERNHVPNGYLIRKSIFAKTGLFTVEAPLEDHYLMLQISKYAKMKFIDEVLFQYRWHTNNTILSNYSKIVEYIKRTCEFERIKNRTYKYSLDKFNSSAKDFICASNACIQDDVEFKIFLDYGDGYSEKNSVARTYMLQVQNKINLALPHNAFKQLRLDPTNIPGNIRIQYIKFSFATSQEKYVDLAEIKTNAKYQQGTVFVFDTDDSNIFIDGNICSGASEVEISFEVLNDKQVVELQQNEINRFHHSLWYHFKNLLRGNVLPCL